MHKFALIRVFFNQIVNLIVGPTAIGLKFGDDIGGFHCPVPLLQLGFLSGQILLGSGLITWMCMASSKL